MLETISTFSKTVKKVYEDLLEKKTLTYEDAYAQLAQNRPSLEPMSVVKRISDEIEMHKKFPNGGAWLKQLIENIEYLYWDYLIILNVGKADLNFHDFIHKLLNDPDSKLSQDFAEFVQEPLHFWAIVEKISEELSNR